MNMMHFVTEYIAKHSRNIGTDVVQHLKAFAAQAHEKMTAEVDIIETEAKDVAEEVTSFVEEKVQAVESAVHELETHAAGAFEHLLHAQHPETETAPKEQE